MKVIVRSLTDEGFQDRDYQNAYEVEIVDGDTVSFSDGEPEDSNLSRNFNDVYKIPALIKQAYEAGKNGEVLEIENIQVDDI